MVGMLPAWATVVLALGGSALTAMAALIAVGIGARRGRDEQWRLMVLDVATAFSEAAARVETAMMAVSGRRFDEREDKSFSAFPADAAGKVPILDERRLDLYVAWDKVCLVLGINSAAATAAETVINETRHAVTAVERNDVAAYLGALIASNNAERGYLTAVNEVLKAPGKVARGKRA